MRDLEIRGAGNLLGSEQSGHVAAVGFELYCRMLDEAVQAARPEDGDASREPGSRCASTCRSTPTCPRDYIPYEVAKIDVHRRIAAAREPADLEALAEELEDRFGPVPGAGRDACSSCRTPGSSSGAPAPARRSFAATGS